MSIVSFDIQSEQHEYYISFPVEKNLMDKKSLSERDIGTKFITPAIEKAGWDKLSQLREQVYFTKGRVIVRGKMVARGKAKFADYILYYKPSIPIAVSRG